MRVIELALKAASAHGFALAGGNALAAHGLLSRPTQDIDLFTPTAGGTGQVVNAVRGALTAEGYAVQLVRAAEDGDFAELHVSRDGQSSQLDLGRDWRAHDAVRLDLGPVLHLDDAVGSKTTALLGRALPRDFIDIAAALNRYSRRQLLELRSSATAASGRPTPSWPCSGWTGSTTTSSLPTSSVPTTSAPCGHGSPPGRPTRRTTTTPRPLMPPRTPPPTLRRPPQLSEPLLGSPWPSTTRRGRRHLPKPHPPPRRGSSRQADDPDRDSDSRGAAEPQSQPTARDEPAPGRPPSPWRPAGRPRRSGTGPAAQRTVRSANGISCSLIANRVVSHRTRTRHGRNSPR